MIILFGGTFDPIHNGHLKLALHIANQFKCKVDLLPLNGTPNYKPAPVASLKQRLEMLELVIAMKPEQLQLNLSETEYPEYSPSYLTLSRLRAKYGKEECFFFIIGGDSLISLNTWDNWQELLKLTNFIVAMRPGYLVDNLDQEIAKHIVSLENYDPNISAGQIVITDFSPVDISSTKIRANCKNNSTITKLIPELVYSYIIQNKLYQ